jgi:hypothetical protein
MHKNKEKKNKMCNNIVPNARCAAGTQCILGGFAPGTHTIYGVKAAVVPGVRLTPGMTATPTPIQATATATATATAAIITTSPSTMIAPRGKKGQKRQKPMHNRTMKRNKRTRSSTGAQKSHQQERKKHNNKHLQQEHPQQGQEERPHQQ